MTIPKVVPFHEAAPDAFYGWADQRAKARTCGGWSRHEGADGALAGILGHYYGPEVGDPAVWGPVVDAKVGDRVGWNFGGRDEHELAMIYAAALVDYLAGLPR